MALEKEKFYKTQDGRVVFNAVSHVGIDGIYTPEMVHPHLKDKTYGWPKSAPTEPPTHSIWAAFSTTP